MHVWLAWPPRSFSVLGESRSSAPVSSFRCLCWNKQGKSNLNNLPVVMETPRLAPGRAPDAGAMQKGQCPEVPVS